MDSFCGSTFWNTSRAWNTDDPDLTICFEKTALVWAPCAFLWIFSPVQLYYALRSRDRDIPWTWAIAARLVLTGVLSIISVADIAVAVSSVGEDGVVFPVEYSTPIIRLVTFILSAFLVIYNKKHGIRTSGVLTSFWILVFILGIPQYRTELRQELYERTENERNMYPFISYMIFLPVALCMLVLNCWADPAPTHMHRKSGTSKILCPEIEASFISQTFYFWFDSFAWKGFKKPLETSDLWALRREEEIAEIVPGFLRHWEKAQLHAGNVAAASKKSKQVSVLTSLIKSFWPTFLVGALLKLSGDILTFVSPQILKLLIAFVGSDDPLWKGLLYAVIMLATVMGETVLLSQQFYRMYALGLHIRTTLSAAVFRKALRISNSARKESSLGEIVNLMSVDAQRFLDLMPWFNLVWASPWQFAVCLYFLYDLLGPSVFAGLAVMIILIPANGYITRLSTIFQTRQMELKDERVKLMNEILGGMKILKLYAWEPSFEKKINEVRQKELGALRGIAYAFSGISFTWILVPFLVSIVTFATYVLIDEKNVLDAEKVFVSLSLFNILRMPLSMLPYVLGESVQTYVSLKRIDKYMNSEDVDPSCVEEDKNEDSAVLVRDATFSWAEEEEPILKNVNIKIEKGSLVAVVGAVGAGKSSLLCAVLGEMHKTSGKVHRKGKVAYVPQQAWIQNATVKDNILFGRELDKKSYSTAIEACALQADLEMLPGGEMTEIGEKGINLSGGQKQRVSLARAVYNDADLYVLDDPLSAVDSHVGKHIFDSVIGPQGALHGKTRILVTHGITFLPEVDCIIVLKDGTVSETGTYKELLARKGAFAEFLLQQLQDKTTNAISQRIDDVAAELEKSSGAEEGLKEGRPRRGRVSESHSESGSHDHLSLGGSRRGSAADPNKLMIRRQSSALGVVPLQKDEDPKMDRLIEEETAETGNIQWHVFRHYFRSIGWIFIFATVAFYVGEQVFSIGTNLWLSVWTSDQTLNVTYPDYIGKRDTYLGVYAALGVGQAIFTLFAQATPRLACLGGSTHLHSHLLKGVLRAPMSFFDTTPSGRILSRFSKDMDVLDNALPMSITEALYDFFEVLSAVVVISYSTPVFVAVIIPVAILYYIVQRFYIATSRQLKRLESVSRSPVYSHFGESISGATSIRAYGVADRFVRTSDVKIDFNQQCYFPSLVASRWLAIRLELMGNFMVFFAALFAVLARDTLSPGLVGLSVTYALQITILLNWLVLMTSEVETNVVAVERIKEYSEVQQEPAWECSKKIVDTNWPEYGRVEFRDYQLRYREGLELVLKGLSFSVSGGEKVGIVGRTGAGKSSLTLALFRIIEAAAGRILVDGVDIAALGLHTLRARLTIIPQDPVLFSGSMRLNLDPFGAHTDAEVWRALELAHLKAFVAGLAGGLGHEVTEGGENLSVGQRQLVCLARALLRKTKVLILDEATAAVDLETDDLIQKTIRQEFADCTILTIAHRLKSIMDSDRILVLDQGKLAEFDSPSALLQKKTSLFYSMARDAGMVQ